MIRVCGILVLGSSLRVRGGPPDWSLPKRANPVRRACRGGCKRWSLCAGVEGGADAERSDDRRDTRGRPRSTDGIRADRYEILTAGAGCCIWRTSASNSSPARIQRRGELDAALVRGR